MTEAQTNDLILKAQQGDESAFEALIRSHYDRLYAMACSYCLNRDLAQDVTQETCLQIARNIRQFKGQSAFLTWAYRITINTAKNMASARRNRQRNETAYAEQLPSIDESILHTLEHREELKRIYTLPYKLRMALILVFAEGMSQKEAAQALGCNEVTVAWRIFKARKLLRGEKL